MNPLAIIIGIILVAVVVFFGWLGIKSTGSGGGQ